MNTDSLSWSTQAHQAHKAAVSAAACRRVDMRRQERGPVLLEHPGLRSGPCFIVVPSVVYNPKIAKFFKAQGFRFDPEIREWRRDTRKPLRGRRYSSAAWLEAARRKFAEIWNVELEAS